MGDRWICGKCRMGFVVGRPAAARADEVVRCPECFLRFHHGSQDNENVVRCWIDARPKTIA